MARKKVSFDKFRLYYITTNERGEKSEKPLDLTQLLKDITEPKFKPAAKEIFGDTYRFQTCQYDEELKVWEMQLLHLREKILPGMAGRESGYEIITLPEGKFAAESSTILYDPKDSIIYMQRNVFCMSPVKMEMYLAELLPEHTKIALKAIKANNNISQIDETKKYRKVVLVANPKEMTNIPEENSLFSLLNSQTRYNGQIMRVEISMGRRKGWLNTTETVKLVQDAYAADGVQKLETYMTRDPDDVECSLVDLMEDRASYSIVVEYSKDNPITHQRLITECKEQYRLEHNC